MGTGTTHIPYGRNVTPNVICKFISLEPPSDFAGTHSKLTKVEKVSSLVQSEQLEVQSIGHYPLSLEERVRLAREKLAKMTDEEKWKLIEDSYGMWEDYPADWLKRMREGTLPVSYMKVLDTGYVLYSRHDITSRLLP